MKGLRERELNPLKILHHVDRLRTLAAGDDIAPVTVEIDPVAYCNHACGWCVDPDHKQERMAPDTFEKLVNELAAFEIGGAGVEGIVLKGGGEPTLHPGFSSMLARASDLGFAVGLVTNGSRLRDLADVLSKRAAYVRISLDGPTAVSHRRIHRSRDFGDIIAGVGALVAARAGRREPVVGLSFAMDSSTVGLTQEAVHLGESLDVDYVLMRPPFFEEVGRAPTMSIKEAQQVRASLHAAATAYQGPLEIMIGNWIGDAEQGLSPRRGFSESGRRDVQIDDHLPIEHRRGRCLASPLLAVITTDGGLYGCCNLRALEPWSMGRIDYARGIGFAELWLGDQRKRVLDRMHQTSCIRHCTHPLSRYNEMIELLRDPLPPHSQFV